MPFFPTEFHIEQDNSSSVRKMVAWYNSSLNGGRLALTFARLARVRIFRKIFARPRLAHNAIGAILQCFDCLLCFCCWIIVVLGKRNEEKRENRNAFAFVANQFAGEFVLGVFGKSYILII